jgi:hypothetical protein
MIALDEVHFALLSAAQDTAHAAARPAPDRFLQGYLAALEDFKALVDDTGVWWQPWVPLEAMPDAAALQARVGQRWAQARRGGKAAPP